MNDKERMDYLLGSVSALACAIRALIDQHPEQESVLKRFEENVEQTDTLALPVGVHETYWKGLAAIKTYLTAQPIR
jgi:hypothetical protein